MNKRKPIEIEADESVVVLRDHFAATCPICREALQDSTTIQRDAGFFYYATRFDCEKDKYWMATRIENHSAICAENENPISDLANTGLAVVKLDLYCSVLRDLIAVGVESYILDKVEQRKNRFDEYIITRSLCDGGVEGLSIYACKVALAYHNKYELTKAAIAMKLSLDFLDDMEFSDHDTILRIAGSQKAAEQIIKKLLMTCRNSGYHSKARQIEAELSINCS